jgi:RNA polymerase sigma factor (sigma-70 family)
MRPMGRKLWIMEQQGGLSDAELVRWALGATTDHERTAAFAAIADKYRLVVLRQCASWYPDPDAAQEVGQAAFEAAFTLFTQGKGPERPDKLAGWLINIARLRGKEYVRKRQPTGVQWADLPEGRGLDETEDDDETRSGSAVRRAHATRLVETVVATLTGRQQEIYQLRFVQEMTGRQIADRLGIADKAASNEATIVQGLIADGFGALILLQEGRTFCRALAAIIDNAATTQVSTGVALTAEAGGIDLFTSGLRQRIVNHFNDCNVCDNCRTCNNKRRQLAGSYAPALIPILFAGEFHERVEEVIRRVVEHAHTGQHSSTHTGSGPTAGPAGAAPAAAAGRPAMAGAAAGSATADAMVTRLQSIVRAVSQSSRTPRWLRRALPQDPSPRASVAMVAGAVAAIVVLVIVVAVAATGGSGGPSPTSQNGAGGGTAAAGTSKCTLYQNFEYEGTSALPVSDSSLASSLHQVIAACTGHQIPITCDDPTDYSAYQPGTVMYACSPPAQDQQEANTLQDAGVVVNPKTGSWVDGN